MKKYMILWLVALLFGQMPLYADCVTDRVIPRPQSIRAGKGADFVLDASVVIAYPASDSDMKRNAEFLSDYIYTIRGIRLRCEAVKALPRKKNIYLHQGWEHPNREAYRLSVSDRSVDIQGKTVAGVFYGIQTLRKLLPIGYEKACRLSPVEIEDYPRFAYRGMMLDVSRHFFNKDEIKQFIEMLALHNINRLHLHLTDDQGWRIEIKKYPRLTAMGGTRKETIVGPWGSGKFDHTPYTGYYTQEDAKELVRYAAERNITIIPEIDLPGHTQAALAAYPEYGCIGGPYEVMTQWGISKEVICAGNPTSLDFLKDILKEVMDIFPSEYIHIGGDECQKMRWEQCPRCQQKIKQLGLTANDEHTPEQQLQSYMTHEIEKFLNTHHRKLIGWTEIMEGGIAPNATLMSWIGESGGIEAARKDHDVVMSTKAYLYFDYYQTEDVSQEPLATYKILPVEKVYSYEPIPASLEQDKQHHIIGVQANLWTEYVPNFYHLQYMTLPRMSALSEIQWTEDGKKDFADFKTRLSHLTPLFKLYRWNYATHVFDVQAQVEKTDGESYRIQLDAMPGATIYYTLDGQRPNEKSTVYRKEFSTKAGKMLKAVAVYPDFYTRVHSVLLE